MLTIQDYAAAYASGQSTPSAAVKEVYARIVAHDDPAVFITLRPLDDVLAEARALERRGPEGLALYGIPVAVKDNIDVAGLPTTAACPDFAYPAEHDATAVARLRAAGALIVGKTNLDQFATGLVGMRSPYGVPRNSVRADPCRAVRVPAPPSRSRPGWCPWRSGPTRPALGACRQVSTTSSG